MNSQSTCVVRFPKLSCGIAIGWLTMATALSMGCAPSKPSAAQVQKSAAERKQWEENNAPKVLEFRKRVACLLETEKFQRIGRRKFAEPFFLLEDESTPMEQRLMKEPNEVVLNAKELQTLDFSQARTVVFFRHTYDTMPGTYIVGSSQEKPVRSKIYAKFYDTADPCRVRFIDSIGEPPGGKTIIDGAEEKKASNASQLMGKLLRHVLGKPGDADFEPVGEPRAVPGGTYHLPGASALGISEDGNTLYANGSLTKLSRYYDERKTFGGLISANLREPIIEPRRTVLTSTQFSERLIALSSGGSQLALTRADWADKFQRALEQGGIHDPGREVIRTTSPKRDIAVLANSTGRVQVVTFPEARKVGEWEMGEFVVRTMVFSPDGEKLAALLARVKTTPPPGSIATCEYWVSVWDWKAAKPVGQVSWASPLPMVCHSLFIVPDGTRIVGATLDGVFVWSFPDLKPVAALAGVSPAAISRDGKLLAAISAAGTWGRFSSDKFWYAASKFDTEPLKRLSSENTIRIWTLPDLEKFRAFDPCEFGPTSAVLFSPNGKELYSAHVDGEICIWDVASGKRSY